MTKHTSLRLWFDIPTIFGNGSMDEDSTCFDDCIEMGGEIIETDWDQAKNQTYGMAFGCQVPHDKC